MAKKLIDVKGMITHKFRLKDFKKAIETTNNSAEKPLKVVITE